MKRKEEELNEIKQFSEDQTSELTKLKKDLHKVERDSKYALEKSESDAKRELNSATAKIEDLQVLFLKKKLLKFQEVLTIFPHFRDKSNISMTLLVT